MGASDTNSPIGDHAIVGDWHSAAIISRVGSTDWFDWLRTFTPLAGAGTAVNLAKIARHAAEDDAANEAQRADRAARTGGLRRSARRGHGDTR